MPKSEQVIIDEIVDHINQEGGLFSTWYTGITSDIDSRLFGDHKVPRENHWYITRPAGSNQAARRIERALIDRYGTDGGPGGGDTSSTIVYSYKKTIVTDP